MPKLDAKGWTLLGLGGYFAYLAHPFEERSDQLARRMVREQSILCLPGTMFCPQDDPSGACQVRIAFANLDADGIAVLFDRMARL